MKYIISFLVINLICLSALAQKEKESLKKTGKLKSEEGEYADIYGDLSKNLQLIVYHNSEGKTKTIKEKKIDWIIWGGRVWQNHIDDDNDRTFMELMATNDKYKLYVTCLPYANHFYVFDMDDKFKETVYLKNKNSFTHVNFNEEDSRAVFQMAKKYFGECTELMNDLQNQLNDKIDVHGRGYFACPGSVEITEMLK